MNTSRGELIPIHPLVYRETIERALLEDLGRGGDLTSEAVIDPRQPAAARIVAREPLRVAGVEVAAAVFRQLDPAVDVVVRSPDGSATVAGTTLLEIRGRAGAILAGERTALNFLGFLSGVATLTGAFVDAVAGTGARVVCTRKTTPGLRALQKYAVRCGGGMNHRFGLDDGVLIKDNHLAVAGGVAAALQRVRVRVGHMVKIELEVDTLEQLAEGLRLGVDAVLLDNMSPAQLREAVHLVAGRAITEASGGITLATAAAVAASGVDLLSVGALTHSARCADLSLEMV